MTDADGLARHAGDAYESVRALNHSTNTAGSVITPPTAYRLLGNLSTAGGHGLAQLLTQLGDRLEESGERGDLYDHASGMPGASVVAAVTLMREASARAKHIGTLLDAAQSAIASVGVREPR